jgi:hypothetical protein
MTGAHLISYGNPSHAEIISSERVFIRSGNNAQITYPRLLLASKAAPQGGCVRFDIFIFLAALE